MPKQFAGRTRLGQSINENSQKQEGTKASKSGVVYGYIKDVLGLKENIPRYDIIVQLIGNQGQPGKLIGPIPLQEHPSVLAANYGSPEDIIGFICRIDYLGTDMKKGSAKIIRPLENNTEAIGQANQLQIKGAAFAPPGSGAL